MTPIGQFRPLRCPGSGRPTTAVRRGRRRGASCPRAELVAGVHTIAGTTGWLPQRVDYSVIEIVARHRHSGVADRGGTYCSAAPLEADQREITCAAAKITNQHQRIRFKALRI